MKLKINSFILYVFIMILQGCIREDVLLPPVVDPIDDALVTGTLRTLKGNHFDPASSQLFINDKAVSIEGTPVLTELQFVVPPVEEVTSAQLKVSTKFGTSTPISVTLLPAVPRIKKIIPSQAGAGKTIKIYGNGFKGTLHVLFKSASQETPIEATFIKPGKDTLEVIVPVGLARDAADVYIVSQSGESEHAPFTVLVPPSITNFVPAKGGPGALIRLTGTDFVLVEDVRFGGLSAEIVTISAEAMQVRVPADAITDTVYVETWGGKGKSKSKFLITPAPSITAVDKLTGGVGTEVTITGKDFQDAFDVRFGNTPTAITSNTGTLLKVKVPTGAESGRISITTPGGKGVSPADFVVEDAPLISSYTPADGSIGTSVTLTGMNLGTITSAKLGLQLLKVISKTDTQVNVEVLTGSVTGKISVVSPGGSFETTGNFIVNGTPQITAISPATGTPGTIVTITGINFPVNPTVKFFNDKTAVVNSSKATEIVCQVPAGATTGKVTVNSALSSSDFTVNLKPVITSITPLKGGVGKEVTINGSYLTGSTIKFYNNITATKVGAGSDTQVIVQVPSGASTGKISVTNPAGVTLSSGDFEVIGAPTIASFSPLTGIAGTTVTISGTNLQHNPVVQFFNQINATIKSVSATQLVVDVPAGAATGKISVRTDAGATPVQSAANFTVIGKPSITSLAPASGTIQEKITINGTNLANPVSVSFDGVTTASFISTSDTKIEVRVPAGVTAVSTHSINVSVKTAADNSGNATFLLLGTPVITKFSPDNNPSSWAFLIEGTNLGYVKKVTLDGKVPTIGVQGIDKQAFNYITTKVPNDVKPPTNQAKTLRLYYTTDDVGYISANYTVLSAPPPGIFPPPSIILPPPLPINYVQTDLSNYWTDPNYRSVTGDTISCYQLRALFTAGATSGSFCAVNVFYATTDEDGMPIWFGLSGTGGTWDNGKVTFSARGHDYTGQVYDQAANSIIFSDENGRQLELKFGGPGADLCFNAFRVPGPCQ